MDRLVDIIAIMSHREEKYVCIKKIDNKAAVTNLDTISSDQRTVWDGKFVEHVTQRTSICQWMLKVRASNKLYIICLFLVLRKHHMSHQCHIVNHLKLSKGC